MEHKGVNKWFFKISKEFKKECGLDLVLSGSRALGLDHPKSDIDMAVIINEDDSEQEAQQIFINFISKKFPEFKEQIKSMKTKAGLYLTFVTVPCELHIMKKVKLDCTIRTRKLHEKIQTFMKNESDNLFPTHQKRQEYIKAVYNAYDSSNEQEYAKLKAWQKKFQQ